MSSIEITENNYTAVLKRISHEANNAKVIQNELEWMSAILSARNKMQLEESVSWRDLPQTIPPDLSGTDTVYAAFIRRYAFDFNERFTLIFALAVHLHPTLLDVFKKEKPASEFGGISGKNHHGFIPTGETHFVCAGWRRFAPAPGIAPLVQQGSYFL